MSRTSLSACNGLLLKYDGENAAAYRAGSNRRIEEGGDEVLRTKGSHHILGHTDGRRTVVLVHRGEIIGPGLMLKILRDCEMERDKFVRLAK